MNDIGHNKPPSLIEDAASTAHDISAWMAENPVIQTEESAREAKLFLDRGKLCIKDLEDERDGRVRPLNEQVKEINNLYKGPRTLLEKISEELSKRIAGFIRAEELRRIEAANTARRIAEEAERAAREAERLEQEALRNAAAGELDIDTKAVMVEADDAFRDYERAARAAALAEKDSHVKIGGGFTRAVSLKTLTEKKETLTVVDPFAAIGDLGLTGDIEEAILKSARAYRKLTGNLPGGIEASVSEGI